MDRPFRVDFPGGDPGEGNGNRRPIIAAIVAIVLFILSILFGG